MTEPYATSLALFLVSSEMAAGFPSANVLLIAKLYFSLSLLSFAPYSTLATEQSHLNAIMKRKT